MPNGYPPLPDPLPGIFPIPDPIYIWKSLGSGKPYISGKPKVSGITRCFGYSQKWLGISGITPGKYWASYFETLTKAQRTRGLSSSSWVTSYHKFKHKSWSHFIFRISTKHQLKISTKHQHLHKTWYSKSWPNLASESRPRFNFISSTKHQQQNAK